MVIEHVVSEIEYYVSQCIWLILGLCFLKFFYSAGKYNGLAVTVLMTVRCAVNLYHPSTFSPFEWVDLVHLYYSVYISDFLEFLTTHLCGRSKDERLVFLAVSRKSSFLGADASKWDLGGTTRHHLLVVRAYSRAYYVFHATGRVGREFEESYEVWSGEKVRKLKGFQPIGFTNRHRLKRFVKGVEERIENETKYVTCQDYVQLSSLALCSDYPILVTIISRQMSATFVAATLVCFVLALVNGIKRWCIPVSLLYNIFLVTKVTARFDNSEDLRASVKDIFRVIFILCLYNLLLYRKRSLYFWRAESVVFDLVAYGLLRITMNFVAKDDVLRRNKVD